jgi:hypothetical protein
MAPHPTLRLRREIGPWAVLVTFLRVRRRVRLVQRGRL